MINADFQQLAERDPQLKPHLKKLALKSDQEQRAWLAGWNQIRNGTSNARLQSFKG